MQPTGYKPEPLKFTDYSYHKIYGAAPSSVEIKPLGRDISGVPIIFQGPKFTCVASTVAWITEYMKRGFGVPALAQDFLALESATASDGATPSQVLDAAHKVGTCEASLWATSNGKISTELELNAAKYRIAGYAFLHDLSPAAIFDALKSNPVMIGVDSYRGSEPHMIAAFDVSDDGKSWKCANWWKSTEQDVIYIPFQDVRFAAAILTEKPVGNVTVPVARVLASKWSFVPLIHKMIASFWALLIAIIGIASSHPGQFLPNTNPPVVQAPVVQEPTPTPDKTYGASGIYDVYHTTISGAGMASTDLTVPVASLTLYTNETITSASTTFPVYLIINPNSATTREKVECNGLNAGTLTWTNCYRGLSAICNNSTSTVSGQAFPHASGEPVIMSNDSCYFNRFVDTNTAQTVNGVKTFTGSGGQIKVGDNTSTTNKYVYFPDGQTNAPYFKVTSPLAGSTSSTFFFSQDGSSELQLNSGGTTVGASTTHGINVTNGLIAITPSSTQGIWFDSNGALAVQASSTASTNGGFLTFNTINQIGYLYFDVINFVNKAWTWASSQIFTSGFTSNGNTSFTGNTTSTGVFQTQNPTSTLDAVNFGTLNSKMFGNGADGALSFSSGTTTLNTAGKYIYQYTSISITGTGVLTTGANLTNHAVYILDQGDLTITATGAQGSVNVKGQGNAGGVGQQAINNNGGAGTLGSTYINAVAAGGGKSDNSGSHAGAGGGGGDGLGNNGVAGSVDGSSANAGGIASVKENYDASMSMGKLVSLCHLGGGGGGGGGGNGTGAGTGGTGGGCIIFIVKGNINITSVFDASGNNGSAGGSGGTLGNGGGGGGGGGFIGIYYGGVVTANSATLTVAGGSGGAGGGGSVVNGGAGGAGGAGQSAVSPISSWLSL